MRAGAGVAAVFVPAEEGLGLAIVDEDELNALEVIPIKGLPIPGDVNGDGIVNIADLVEVLLNWGPCQDCPADLNGDDVVDVLDLVEVLLNWG